MTDILQRVENMLGDCAIGPMRTLKTDDLTRVLYDAHDEIEHLRRERDEATRYAENLAVALSRHFPHASQWKPLTGDLVGLLTQIDNMTTGLSPSCAAFGGDK